MPFPWSTSQPCAIALLLQAETSTLATTQKTSLDLQRGPGKMWQAPGLNRTLKRKPCCEAQPETTISEAPQKIPEALVHIWAFAQL